MNISEQIKSWGVYQMANAISYGTKSVRRPALRRFLIDTLFQRYIGWRNLEVRCRTAFGVKMDLCLPDAVQTSIYLTGWWEPTISGIFSTSLEKGDIVIDIGANVEYYTLLASSLVGATGKVYAIEASPRIFKRLERNVSINSICNVKLFNVAVSNEAGKVWIWTAPESNLGHSTIVNKVALADGHRQEAEVPSNVISALVPLNDLLAARLIKMDIEGAERLAIEGVLPHLCEFSERTEWLIELSPAFSPGGYQDTDWIFNSFIEAGYSAYCVENSYKPLSSTIDELNLGQVVRTTEPPRTRLSDVLFSKIREGDSQKLSV